MNGFTETYNQLSIKFRTDCLPIFLQYKTSPLYQKQKRRMPNKLFDTPKTSNPPKPDEDAEFLKGLKKNLRFFDTKFTKYIKSLSSEERGKFFDFYTQAENEVTTQGEKGAKRHRSRWLILGGYSDECLDIFARPQGLIMDKTKEWNVLQEVRSAWRNWKVWLERKHKRCDEDPFEVAITWV